MTQETQGGTNVYTDDIANRLVVVDGVDYLLDDNPKRAGAGGNLLFDGASFYNYDYANRLTSVKEAEA